MSQVNAGKIKEVIVEFFSKTGLAIEAVNIGVPQDSTIPIGLKMEEPQVIIGEGGQALADVQRLLKLVIQKKIAPESHFYIDLDVNEYKKKKVAYLREMARAAADEVSLTKKEKDLPPMQAYDRRIIHLELAARLDIATESVGYGLERRVLVKLRSQEPLI